MESNYKKVANNATTDGPFLSKRTMGLFINAFIISLAVVMIVWYFVNERSQFPVKNDTISNLNFERSRVVLGGADRFVGIAQKIKGKNPLNVLILGGSITCLEPIMEKRWYDFFADEVLSSIDNRCESATGTDWVIHRLSKYLIEKE